MKNYLIAAVCVLVVVVIIMALLSIFFTGLYFVAKTDQPEIGWPIMGLFAVSSFCVVTWFASQKVHQEEQYIK